MAPDPNKLSKKFPKKLVSCRNMRTNTLTRREYKGKIYVKEISRDVFDPGSGMEKLGSATMCLSVCRSRSGIRRLFDPWIRGFPDPGSRIPNPYF
jgi:hypothetical protein